jgi:hypothetical protein
MGGAFSGEALRAALIATQPHPEEVTTVTVSKDEASPAFSESSFEMQLRCSSG